MRAWTKDTIKNLRRQLGLSQAAFGELVGVTRMAVYYLERGVRTPSKTLAILMERIDQKEKEAQKHGEKDARTV